MIPSPSFIVQARSRRSFLHKCTPKSRSARIKAQAHKVSSSQRNAIRSPRHPILHAHRLPLTRTGRCCTSTLPEREPSLVVAVHVRRRNVAFMRWRWGDAWHAEPRALHPPGSCTCY